MSILQAYLESLGPDGKWTMDKVQLIPKAPKSLLPVLTMTKGSYAFSFPERGLPARGVLSENIQKLYDSTFRPKGASWRTREEIISKSAQLLIVPDEGALEMRRLLIKLLIAMGDLDEDARKPDPKHQRVVFWW